MKKIKRIIQRNSWGCFDVEDENGDCFRIQLAYKIEEIWQKNKLENKKNKLQKQHEKI